MKLNNIVMAVIGFAIGLILIAEFVISSAFPAIVDNAAFVTAGAKASATFTFTGNTNDGEFVNITKGSTTECFEFDTEGNLTAGCYAVDVASSQTAANSAYALAQSINTNSMLVTASNSSATVTIRAATAGVDGNNIYVTDTVTNLTTQAYLTGGHEPAPVATAAIVSLFGLIVVVMILVYLLRGLR
jgi:phage tail sheath gpL-like